LYSWEDMLHTLYTVGPAHKTCVSDGRSYSFREIVDYIHDVLGWKKKRRLEFRQKKLYISYTYFMKNED